MLKYVQNTLDRFKDFRTGLTAHADLWTGQTITVDMLTADITEIETVNSELEALEIQVENKTQVLKKLIAVKDTKADKIEKQIEAIHADTADQVADYGMSVPAERQNKPLPSKGKIDSVAIDGDGEGFEVVIIKDENASYYELEIAKTKAEELTATPPFAITKTTKKLVYNYDDVAKGTRCHFRVRAVNAAGSGEWSDISTSNVV